jgi:hypothetical protein
LKIRKVENHMQCMKSICGICGAQHTFDFRKLHVIMICALRNLNF